MTARESRPNDDHRRRPRRVVGFLLGAGTVWGIVLFVVAGIMLATATTGFCATYTVLGISTDP
ncbi:MAG TPA: DUF2892 domain-containing protein [Gaiellaceae bacterium]|nr:DUF2892 domain-containing protein [Gaiellaceae bacterium]